MKKSVFLVLVILIFLTSCSSNDLNKTTDAGKHWDMFTGDVGGQDHIDMKPTARPTNISSNQSCFKTDLIQWLKSITKIPIYLPEEWNPLKREEKKLNYYIEASGNSNSYSLNVYKTKVPISFNDEEDLLNKNGPVSESNFVGSISGEQFDAADPFNIPKDAVGFELISKITAFQNDDGCSVWWTEKGWNFSYIGPKNNQTLKELAIAYSKSDLQFSKTGEVKIVGGNRLTFYYTWVKDGYRYGFTTHETNFNKTFHILNSFIYIDENIN